MIELGPSFFESDLAYQISPVALALHLAGLGYTHRTGGCTVPAGAVHHLLNWEQLGVYCLDAGLEHNDEDEDAYDALTYTALSELLVIGLWSDTGSHRYSVNDEPSDDLLDAGEALLPLDDQAVT